MGIACPDTLKGADILITGGAGFLSSNVIEAVIDGCRVTVLDTFERDCIANLPPETRFHPNLTVINGSVTDASLVESLIPQATHVLHMAAIAGVSTVVRRPAHTFETNLFGTHTVLEAIRRKGHHVKRFIDFSTSEVYGPHVYRAKEDGQTTQGSLYHPRWYYAVSKLASEFLTHAYHTEYGLPTVGIRPFNIYGKYQLGEGCVRNYVEAALRGEPLTVHWDGAQIRSWCYVDDMTRAILAALTEPQAIGEHFNVGNPRATASTLGLAEMVLRLSGSESCIEFKDILYPDVEVRVPDTTALAYRLNVRAEVGLEDGLQRTIDWWRTL